MSRLRITRRGQVLLFTTTAIGWLTLCTWLGDTYVSH